jgi:hypothetical protein
VCAPHPLLTAVLYVKYVDGEGYDTSDRQIGWRAPGDIPVTGRWNGGG